MRIVFLGTPDFAAASLEALHKAGKEIVAVVTAPDKPAGRGMQLQQSAVKQYAVAHNLRLLQPEKLKSEKFLEQLNDLKPDLGIVVAFRMLPELVWNMPPMGTFNLHASLLPQYRGAAPIHWAVINGERKTGVTTFFLKHEIDTGDIILQRETKIGDMETTGDVYNRLMNLGASLVVETVDYIEAGAVKTIQQSMDGGTKLAPKIFKNDARIDWTSQPIKLHNLIRGMSPFPGAWTLDQNDRIIKIYRSKYEVAPHTLDAGHVVIQGADMKIACTGGFIWPLELQSEGRKKMKVEEWVKGNEIRNVS